MWKPYKTHYLDNGWEAYYDRSLRLWVAIQKDGEGNNIAQSNGQEAVYGISLDEVKSRGEDTTASIHNERVQVGEYALITYSSLSVGLPYPVAEGVAVIKKIRQRGAFEVSCEVEFLDKPGTFTRLVNNHNVRQAAKCLVVIERKARERGEFRCDCCDNAFYTEDKDKDNFIFSEAKGETGICRDCHREEYGSWHTASELEDIRDNELEMRERDGE